MAERETQRFARKIGHQIEKGGLSAAGMVAGGILFTTSLLGVEQSLQNGNQNLSTWAEIGTIDGVATLILASKVLSDIVIEERKDHKVIKSSQTLLDAEEAVTSGNYIDLGNGKIAYKPNTAEENSNVFQIVNLNQQNNQDL